MLTAAKRMEVWRWRFQIRKVDFLHVELKYTAFSRPTWDCRFQTPIKTPQHIYYDRLYTNAITNGPLGINAIS